ncbi:MAG TPA: uracil-DNA glycosylase [Devosia sp.]|nr:uracil-DNA glycosylase [Devosia sp.]
MNDTEADLTKAAGVPPIPEGDAGAPMHRMRMLDILEWYRDGGVDVCVSETPVNRLLDPAAKSVRPVPPEQGTGAVPAPPLSTPAAERVPARQATAREAKSRESDTQKTDTQDAARIAAACDSLEMLNRELGALEGCDLRKRATRTVCGDGPLNPQVMVVGKAPGREDDLTGVAFSGPAGALLDNMLAAISLDRSQVYLTHLVPWRPPGGRDPAPQEIALCRPFLQRRIELVAPRILLVMGSLARTTLLDDAQKGTPASAPDKDENLPVRAVHTSNGDVQAMCMMPPDFLLRQPAQKKAAWQVLKQVRRLLDGNPGGADHPEA